MKTLFVRKRKISENIIDMDFLENVNLSNDISVTSFIRSFGYLLKNFKVGNITKVTMEQTLVEMISIVNKTENFDFPTKNRLYLMLFQELKSIQRSKQSSELLLISGIKLTSFLLKKLKLSNVVFIGCIMDEADLSESIFTNCEFRGCSFVETDLTKVKFVKSKFTGCDFEGATIEKTVGL